MEQSESIVGGKEDKIVSSFDFAVNFLLRLDVLLTSAAVTPVWYEKTKTKTSNQV